MTPVRNRRGPYGDVNPIENPFFSRSFRSFFPGDRTATGASPQTSVTDAVSGMGANHVSSARRTPPDSPAARRGFAVGLHCAEFDEG